MLQVHQWGGWLPLLFPSSVCFWRVPGEWHEPGSTAMDLCPRLDLGLSRAGRWLASHSPLPRKTLLRDLPQKTAKKHFRNDGLGDDPCKGGGKVFPGSTVPRIFWTKALRGYRIDVPSSVCLLFYTELENIIPNRGNNDPGLLVSSKPVEFYFIEYFKITLC